MNSSGLLDLMHSSYDLSIIYSDRESREPVGMSELYGCRVVSMLDGQYHFFHGCYIREPQNLGLCMSICACDDFARKPSNNLKS